MEAWRMNKPEGWRVPVRLESIPDSGLHLEIDADDEVRSRLAAARRAARCDAAACIGRPDAPRRGAARLGPGERDASVRPASSRSSRSKIGRRGVRRPVPAARAGRRCRRPPQVPGRGGRRHRARPLVDGIADIGAVATEFLLLGIDPYPRKAGAVFAPPVEDRAADSPFAVLAGSSRLTTSLAGSCRRPTRGAASNCRIASNC